MFEGQDLECINDGYLAALPYYRMGSGFDTGNLACG